MAMGRPNKGADHVDGLRAEQRDRERLRALLLTMTGALSNEDAARELGIGLSQLANLRKRALQGAVDALAPGQPGRPRCRSCCWRWRRWPAAHRLGPNRTRTAVRRGARRSLPPPGR